MIEIKNAGGLTMSEWRRKTEAGEELTPDEQRQIDDFRKNMAISLEKILPSAEILRNAVKIHQDTIKRAFAAIDLAKPMLESMRRMREQISESTRYFAESFTRMEERLGEWIKQSFESLRILFERSHIQLIVHASEGDPVSLVTLGKMWWRLWFLYNHYKFAAREDPTKEDFHQEIAVACLKFLKEEEERRRTPLFEVAQKIFYRLQYELAKRYIKIQEERSGGFSVTVFSDPNGELPNGYFTETVAQLAGVSSRTIRNWIKSGKIPATQGSYFSVTRQKKVSVYITPYSLDLGEVLDNVKSEKLSKKYHKREGLLTISEVRVMYDNQISRKTLERWDSSGILVPARIGGYRYYTREQADSVGQILLKNNSPHIRKALAFRTVS